MRLSENSEDAVYNVKTWTAQSTLNPIRSLYGHLCKVFQPFLECTQVSISIYLALGTTLYKIHFDRKHLRKLEVSALLTDEHIVFAAVQTLKSCSLGNAEGVAKEREGKVQSSNLQYVPKKMSTLGASCIIQMKYVTQCHWFIFLRSEHEAKASAFNLCSVCARFVFGLCSDRVNKTDTQV